MSTGDYGADKTTGTLQAGSVKRKTREKMSGNEKCLPTLLKECGS